MNKNKKSVLVLIVILAFPSLTTMSIFPQTVKAESNDYIASEQGAFCILSPLNRTYNTNALTLSIKFASFRLQYTFECFVDGKFQGNAPYTVNVNGTHIQ
jgi:hypothetical protein